MKRKKTPVEIYDEIVQENLKIDLTEMEKYKDPDQKFIIEVKPIICIPNNGTVKTSITMASDGICGIKKINMIAENIPSILDRKKYVELKYRLLREGMFDCLAWPSHACGINQLRGCRTIFDDRIDLTLLDIQKFYNVIKGKAFSVELINAIEKHCRLSMAYLNTKTFSWLCSFSDFDDFIRRNGACLEYFVTEEDGKYVAKCWTGNEEKRFNEKYFIELCKKVEKYKVDKQMKAYVRI